MTGKVSLTRAGSFGVWLISCFKVRGTDTSLGKMRGHMIVVSCMDSKKLPSRDARAAGIRKRCCAVLWRDQLTGSREVRLSNSPGRLDGALEVETYVLNQHAQFLQRL